MYRLKDVLRNDKSKKCSYNECNILVTKSIKGVKSNDVCIKCNHSVSSNVTNKDFLNPTRFLAAATNNKANAVNNHCNCSDVLKDI